MSGGSSTITMDSTPHSYAVPHSTIANQNDILLDSSIRDWVVLPLLIIMVQAGLLRHYLSLVLKSSSTRKLDKVEHRTKATIARSSRLRSGNGSYLSQEKWDARVQYFTTGDSQQKASSSSDGNGNSNNHNNTNEEEEGGYLREEMQWIDEETDHQQKIRDEKIAKGEPIDDPTDNMMDPMAMMGPMKGQFAFMAQNMILMQGIGYFFSGYVLVKVPIPLTNGFKMMFQRGLDLSTLETSYVSSVSWYFLVMFGLRAFFKLVIEGDNAMQEEHKRAGLVQTDLGNGFNAGGQQKKFDAKGFLKGEIESLELMKYRSVLDDADRRLLGKKAKKHSGFENLAANDDGQPGFDIFGAAATSSGSSSAGKGKGKKKKGKVKST